MKKILLITYSLLMMFVFQSRAENNIMYDKANQLYHNKNYDSAAQLYQQMLNDGYCHADLYYNAGNAYYRLNKIGLAIWSYEKALQLQDTKNYNDNLALAKKRIKEPIEKVNDIFFIRWWESMYGFFTANVWAVLALVFFLLSFLQLFIKKVKPQIRFSPAITNILFAVSGYCLLMMMVNSYNQAYHYKAIIIEPKTLFLASSKKEPVFLSEGVEVKVIDRNISSTPTGGLNYIMVKLPDGRIGRINHNSIKKL